MEKMKDTEKILYEICSDHRHYFDDSKIGETGLTDKDLALRIVDILRVEIIKLQQADKIVRRLAMKDGSIIWELIYEAQNYVTQNPK